MRTCTMTKHRMISAHALRWALEARAKRRAPGWPETGTCVWCGSTLSRRDYERPVVLLARVEVTLERETVVPRRPVLGMAVALGCALATLAMLVEVAL